MGRLVSRRGVLVLRLRVSPSGFRGRVGGRGLCLGVHVRTGVTLGKRLRLSHLSGWWDLTRAAQLRELPGFGETNPGRQRQSDDARPVVQRGTMSGEDAAKPTAADPDFDPALEEKNMTKEAQARSIRADRNAENPEQSLLDALEDYMILCGGDPLEDVSDPRVDIAPQSPPRDPVQIGPRTSRPDPPPDRIARPTPRARPSHASATFSKWSRRTATDPPLTIAVSLTGMEGRHEDAPQRRDRGPIRRGAYPRGAIHHPKHRRSRRSSRRPRDLPI